MGNGKGLMLDLVQILILRRNCKNFIFNKAIFAVECGQFGEKFNAVKNKIGQLQPRNQYLNKLLEGVPPPEFFSRHSPTVLERV
jgi:hypothetical protein